MFISSVQTAHCEPQSRFIVRATSAVFGSCDGSKGGGHAMLYKKQESEGKEVSLHGCVDTTQDFSMGDRCRHFPCQSDSQHCVEGH